MAYGFDPSIILSATQTPQTSLGDLVNAANSGVRRTQELYGLQRQQSLADLVSQNSGAFNNPYAASLARGGFGQEAADAEQQGQLRDERDAKLSQIHAELVRGQMATAKTPQQYEQTVARLSPEARSLYNLPDKWDGGSARDAFIASGMAPEARGKYEDEQRRRGLLADTSSALNQFRGGLVQQLGGKVPQGLNTGDISDPEMALLERAQASRERAAALRAIHGPTQAPPVDDAQLNLEADHFASRGSFILPGRSKEAIAHNREVMARALQRHADLDPGAAAAAYRANSASLEHQQVQADTVNSFTRTFDKNIGLLEDALGKLDSSNTPMLNKGLRAWQSVTGSPDLIAARNALNTVRSELGKINSGSTGQGGVPISVLQEMEHGLPEDATPAQFLAALKVYRQDSVNRRQAMSEQLGETQGRIKGRGRGGKAPADMPTPPVVGTGSFSLEPGEPSPGQAAPSVDHDAAAAWLRDPTNKTNAGYARALAAYKKAHGGAEP